MSNDKCLNLNFTRILLFVWPLRLPSIQGVRCYWYYPHFISWNVYVTTPGFYWWFTWLPFSIFLMSFSIGLCNCLYYLNTFHLTRLHSNSLYFLIGIRGRQIIFKTSEHFKDLFYTYFTALSTAHMLGWSPLIASEA